MALLISMLDYLGVDKGRVRVEWVSASEGARFASIMNEFADTIKNLGRNVRLEDIRCRN